MNRYRITIKSDAGKERENGHPDPIAASRGRVFYRYAETQNEAIVGFCKDGIPPIDRPGKRIPATTPLLHDFDIALADESDNAPPAIENWTKARP